MSTEGTIKFTEDGQAKEYLFEEVFCKRYLSFMNDDEIKIFDHLMDGDTGTIINPYEWIDDKSLKIFHGQNTRNGEDYHEMLLYDFSKNEIRLSRHGGNNMNRDTTILTVVYRKVDNPFPYKIINCPELPIIGKWELASNSFGKAYLKNNGITKLIYNFKENNLVEISTGINGNFTNETIRYENQGELRHKKLLLFHKDNVISTFKISRPYPDQLKIRGQLGDDFIQWKLKRIK